MGKAPAYQWYPKDALTDEKYRRMTLEEKGAYRELLDHQWLNESIPADPSEIAKILGVSKRVATRLMKALKPCFKPMRNGSRLRNEKLARQHLAITRHRNVLKKVASEAWKARKRAHSGAPKKRNVDKGLTRVGKATVMQSQYDSNALHSSSPTTLVVPSPTPPTRRGETKPRISEVCEGQAREVLAHCNSLPNIPSVVDSDTKIYRDCLRVIADRIKDGQSVEELKAHADHYNGKMMAHRWHEKHYGDEPKASSTHWCPHKWTPNELFGPKRFAKYFVKWRDEPVLTQEVLFQERERMLYG